jgi:hypothetical protein
MLYVPALDLGTVTFRNSSGAGFAGNTLCYEIIDSILGIERASQFDGRKNGFARKSKAVKNSEA